MVSTFAKGKVVAQTGRTGTARGSALCALPMRGAGLRGAVTGEFGNKIALNACSALLLAAANPDPRAGLPGDPVTLVIPLAPGTRPHFRPRHRRRALARAQGGDHPVNRPGAGGAPAPTWSSRQSPTRTPSSSTTTAPLVFAPSSIPKQRATTRSPDLTPLGLASARRPFLAVRGRRALQDSRPMAEHAKKNPGKRAHRDRRAGSVGDSACDAQFAHRGGA